MDTGVRQVSVRVSECEQGSGTRCQPGELLPNCEYFASPRCHLRGLRVGSHSGLPTATQVLCGMRLALNMVDFE